MLRLAVLAAASVFLSFSSAGAGSDAKTCNAGQARLTTVEAIQANFDAYTRKCVRLRGIRMGNRLYSSREALLEKLGMYGKDAKHSLVVYARGSRDRGGQARLVEIVGTIGSCRIANEEVDRLMARGDGFYMVTGYCHTSLANYIRPDQIRVLAANRIPRLTEAEVSPELRELVEFPHGMTVPQDHLNAARQLVTAILNGDQSEYFRLTQPGFEGDLQGARRSELPDWLRERMADARTEFRDEAPVAQFRALGDWPRDPLKILVARDELGELTGKERRLISCWCKTGNCKGRWPVMKLDADSDPTRPYICVLTYDYLLGPGAGHAVQAQAPSRRTVGFAEPQWRAAARK